VTKLSDLGQSLVSLLIDPSLVKPERTRLELFDRFSANWKLTRPLYNFGKDDGFLSKEYNEAVMCPLCTRIFKRSALAQDSQLPLTLEHCPPNELGGKPKILLCKACNSETGHNLDVKLMDYLNVMPFNKGEAGAVVTLKKTKLLAGRESVGGRSSLKRTSESVWSFELLANDNYRKTQLQKILSGQQFQVEYEPHKTPTLHIVHTALLKIAYLLTFAKFGHVFILHHNYDQLRRQILFPQLSLLPSKGVATKTSLPVGFYLIKQPIYARGLFVVFEMLFNKRVEKYGVIINHPNRVDLEFYSTLRLHESKIFGLEQEAFRDLDYLTAFENIELFLYALHKPYQVDLARMGLDFYH
jgi:hypothetical protein